MKVHIRKDVGSIFFFDVIARNGRILCWGTGYETRANAMKTIKLLFPKLEVVDHTKKASK